jgi:hypothetical protein
MSSSAIVCRHRSSSNKSSIEPLIKPESGIIGNGGSTGLEQLGNPASITGGDEGMINWGSKMPW